MDDRERLKNLRDAIDAWLDGQEVERSGSIKGWSAVTKPWGFIYSDKFEYRVKPKPREWLLSLHRETGASELWGKHHSPEEFEFIRVREVLDD